MRRVLLPLASATSFPYHPVMAKISAFADEIGDDLEFQITTLRKNGVDNIELRGVWGKNILDLTSGEIATIAKAAANAGIGFSSIGSPIGKFGLERDFDEQKEGVRKAAEFANTIGARYIRVFSFYIPHGEDPADHRTQVIDWLGKLADIAEASGVILAHENEANIYGDSGERCLDLYQSITSKSFTGVFDFANFVVYGHHPYDECWSILKPYITYFHIKDCRLADKVVVPAGEGDGDVKRILADAYAGGYENYLTLEPHLSKAGANSGKTSPELFGTAVTALNKILDEIGAS